MAGGLAATSRPENHRLARVDRRRRQHQSGKRRCVVVMRQRGGGRPVTAVVTRARPRPSRSFVVASPEGKHCPCRRGESFGTIFMRPFEMKRINHGEAYSKDGACTNQAESYISRLRRAGDWSQHHHIAGPHLGQYAEAKWRGAKTCAATPPELQFHACGRLALGHPPSPAWAGYWQRHRLGARKFVKPPDRRSARARRGRRHPTRASWCPRLLRRFTVSLTFHWTRTKLARSAGSSPVSIITALTRELVRGSAHPPDEAHRAHGATNLLVRTRDQIDVILFGGIVSSSIAGANRRMVASR